ncbi:Fic family protein [Desulfobaculum xiamenense]
MQELNRLHTFREGNGRTVKFSPCWRRTPDSTSA